MKLILERCSAVDYAKESKQEESKREAESKKPGAAFKQAIPCCTWLRRTHTTQRPACNATNKRHTIDATIFCSRMHEAQNVHVLYT